MKFTTIQARAAKRKGGLKALQKLLHPTTSIKKIQTFPDDRALAAMAKCLFRAGFHWKVIYAKWPDFEQAFYGFRIKKLLSLPPEHWEGYVLDTRIVRNRQKIEAVYDNAVFIHNTTKTYGSFGKFIAQWDDQDQIGLLQHLKKHGSRLGGHTGMYLLRMMGKDSFLLSPNVMQVLVNECGLDVNLNPTSQRDLKKIQAHFMKWKKQTGLGFTHLSQICAFSVGPNYDAPTIQFETGKWNNI